MNRTLLLTLALISMASAQVAPDQQVFAVWDRACLAKVELESKSYMEAPIGKDNKPDISKAKIFFTPVTFAEGCGLDRFRYEVRTTKPSGDKK